MKIEPLSRVEIYARMPYTDNEYEHDDSIAFAREIEAEVNARWEAMLSKQETLEVTDELLENLVEQFEPEIPPIHDDLYVAYASGLADGKKQYKALLRQALEALEWEYGGEPLGTLTADAIKAIKEALK